MILFVTIGQQPFQDSVYAINPDGSNRQPILASERGKSYTYASGNSLQRELVVMVHELDVAGQVVDHLYLHSLKVGAWRRLMNKSGMEGAGCLAPDDTRVAFLFAPESQPTKLRPWITNLTTGETFQLTSEDNEEGAWDGYLSWRPDGQEVTFLRLRRSSSGGVTSTLMHLRSSGGQPTELLEPGEWIIAACYAPDGERLAVLTKRGLEIVEIATTQRKLILAWDRLPSAQFRTGGLIWSKDLDKIAFAILNRQAKRYELWTISPDGHDAKKIYDRDESEGQLIVTSFVQR